jgi:small-conductance mechanosensitive channel
MKNKKTLLFVLLLVSAILLLSACATETPEDAEEPTATNTTEGGAAAEGGGEEEEQLIMTPTLRPTATPGVITELVTDITTELGIDEATFLGLTADDWINLGISVLLVLVGGLLGGRLVVGLLRRVTKSTSSEFDDEFVGVIAPQIYWLVLLFSARFAVERLQFLNEDLRQWVDVMFFTLNLAILFYIAWKLIDFGTHWYRREIAAEADTARLDRTIPLIARALKVILVLIGLVMLLDRFGVNVNGLVAALGIGGLALSLAAQDTLADAISGVVIYLDEPFRIGDRIEIQGLNTWGDVIDIGTRTTRIRTRDNRMVIVPNSTIGKSQVVNYTYPDPQYRVQIDIGVAYGTDLDQLRRVVIDTLQHVDGVLKDKPIDVLYNEIGHMAMTVRIRWWIESYEDTRRIYDRVNTAVENALNEAGIEMPFDTYNLNLKLDEDDINRFSEVTK